MSDSTELTPTPLFPLPNVVLFPRAVLPLHIFEERYKIMTADALAGDRRIAMALLREGWEKNYHATPAVQPVVCVGTILSHQRLPDGRFNFLLQGVCRARAVRVGGARPYQMAELEPLVESPAMEIDLAEQRRRFVEVFEAEPISAGNVGRRFRQLLAGPLGTAAIADLVAFNFLEDVALKQSLLADADVRRRVDRTIDAFESAYSPLLQGSTPGPLGRDPSFN